VGSQAVKKQLALDSCSPDVHHCLVSGFHLRVLFMLSRNVMAMLIIFLLGYVKCVCDTSWLQGEILDYFTTIIGACQVCGFSFEFADENAVVLSNPDTLV
jgi:hypothetical protein